MQSSRGRTKILPSPISPAGPVRPPLMMASIVGSRKASLTRDHQLHLPQEVDGELVAAVGLGVPALPAEALHVHHGQAEDLDVGQGLLDGLQAMRLNDGDNQFHGQSLLAWLTGANRSGSIRATPPGIASPA